MGQMGWSTHEQSLCKSHGIYSKSLKFNDQTYWAFCTRCIKEARIKVTRNSILSYRLNFFDFFLVFVWSSPKADARDVITSFVLRNFTQISDDELRCHNYWYGTMTLMLKHIHDRDILPLLRHQLKVMRKIEKRSKIAVFTSHWVVQWNPLK